MKIFTKTICLAAAVLLCHSVSAQTVTATIAGGQSATYTADQLRTGLLADRTYIEITGTWNRQQLDSLSASLHTQYKIRTLQISNNEHLGTIIMRDAVFSGDSISFAATFYACTQLGSVVFPSTSFNGKIYLGLTFASSPKLFEVVNLDKLPKICDLSYAFMNCAKLESLRFSSTMNNNNVDFTAAFNGCTRLQSIDNFDAFVRISSLTTTFQGCESLTEIRFFPSLKYFDRETFFMSAFSGCRNLAKIENLDSFVNMRTSSPIYMTETFKDCEKLDSIRLRPDGSHLINLNNAFNGCRNLRKFNSGDLVFTSLDHAFKGCAKLEEFVCHPNSANHDKLVNMGSAFSGCTSLKIPASSSFCYRKINDIDSCFYNCSSLEVVSFTQPQSFWIPAWSMFEGCSSLEYVYGFENFTDLNSLRYTFKNCNSLKEIHLGTDPNSLATYSDNIEGTFGTGPSSLNYTTQYPYNIKLYEVRNAASCIKFLPDGVTTVPTQWINANYNNFVVPLTVTSSLSDLTVYEGDYLYNKIQTATFTVSPDYAYRDSLYWEIVEYGNWIRIEDVSHFKFNRIHDRGQLAFYVENKKGAYGKSIILTVNPIAIACYTRSGFQTYVKTEPPTSFNDLDGQKISNAYRIELSGNWTSQQLRYVLDRIGYSPDSIRIFDASTANGSDKMDYSFAFKNCPNLTSVRMPSAQKVVRANSFCENCPKLVNADMGWAKLERERNDYYAVFLSSAFRNCSSLESVTLPSVPTNEPISADSTFYGCSKLKRVNYLERISNFFSLSNCFNGCSSLEYLELGADVSTLRWGENTFDGVPDALIKWLPENCPDVPDEWKGYKNFVLPLHITLSGTLEGINGIPITYGDALDAGATATIAPLYAYVKESNYPIRIYPDESQSDIMAFRLNNTLSSSLNGYYVALAYNNGRADYVSNRIRINLESDWTLKAVIPGNPAYIELPLGKRMIKSGNEYYATKAMLNYNDANLYGELLAAGWLVNATEVYGKGSWNNNMIRHLRWAITGAGYHNVTKNPSLQLLDLSEVQVDATDAGTMQHDLWSPSYHIGAEVNPAFKGKLSVSLDSLCYSVNYPCKYLTQVKLPSYAIPGTYSYNGVSGASTTIEVSINSTFRGCNNLSDIQNLDKIHFVSDMAYAFYKCSRLEEVELSLTNDTGRGPKSMRSCFDGCSNLENVVLSYIDSYNSYYRETETKTSLVRAFADCPKLEYVQIFNKAGDFTSFASLNNSDIANTWAGSDQCTKFVKGGRSSEVPDSWKSQYHNFVIYPLQIDIKGYNIQNQLNDDEVQITAWQRFEDRIVCNAGPSYAWQELNLVVEDHDHNLIDANATPQTYCNSGGRVTYQLKDWYNTAYEDHLTVYLNHTGVNETADAGSGVTVTCRSGKLVFNNPDRHALVVCDMFGRIHFKSDEACPTSPSLVQGTYLVHDTVTGKATKVMIQ